MFAQKTIKKSIFKPSVPMSIPFCLSARLFLSRLSKNEDKYKKAAREAADFCFKEAKQTERMFIRDGSFHYNSSGVLSDPTEIDVPYALGFYLAAAQYYSNAGLYDDAKDVLQQAETTVSIILGRRFVYEHFSSFFSVVEDFNLKLQNLRHDVDLLTVAIAASPM